MAEVESLAERARRKRREGGHWTVEDEQKWLTDHPDDEPHPVIVGVPITEPEPEHEDDLVPDIEPYERTPEDEAIDAAIARVGIVEAYNRWAGKGTVDAGSKREGIKVRCPNPSHPDKNPSAWLNTDKDVWVCGGCGMEGGDKFDIAAWHFGMPVPGYKGDQFPELRRRMASELGVSVVKSITGKSLVAPSSDDADTDLDPDSDDEQDNVVHLTPGERAEAELLLKQIPKLDWRSITSGDTFLGKWMTEMESITIPSDYLFWLGLQALGFAIGSDTVLDDHPPVHGNLYVVLVGGSGGGKSQAQSRLTWLLREALPYDDTDPTSSGTKIIGSPGSGEALVNAFVRIEQIDDNPPQFFPVRGLVRFSEMSELMGKAERAGNTLKTKSMELYDSYDVVDGGVTVGRGNIQAHGPFCSIITTTQPSSIRENLQVQDARSGFGNRWVYIIDNPKGYIPLPAKDTPDIDGLSAVLRGIRAFYSTKPKMIWSSEGRAKFVEWAMNVVGPYKMKEEDDFAPMMARADLTIKKLILLLAVDRKEREISARTVEDATWFWGYLEATYRYVTSELGAGPSRDAQKRITQILVDWEESGRKRPPTSRDIIRAAGANYDLMLMKNVLKTMVEMGLVSEEVHKPKGGGHVSTVYKLASDA